MNTILSIETFIFERDRDVPYLGPLAAEETINARGYIVRKGNGTLYPTKDRSVLVKTTMQSGHVGWGETYGICAPRAVCEIINDMYAPTLVGQSLKAPAEHWGDMYDYMRVRGHWGGFTLDAIAAIDIALWDIWAQLQKKPLYAALGPTLSKKIPCYVSGLPAASMEDRVTLAKAWQNKGYNAIKFAAAVSHEGVVAEAESLRHTLGPDGDIMIDLHWKYGISDAISLSKQLFPLNLRFIEAPVKPEDTEGLARVKQNSEIPIAAGEEWRTEFDILARLKANSIDVFQPEMGHTGVTQFMSMCALAHEHNVEIMPHATIGLGIFMAASLHASATMKNLPYHEYQHSVFDENQALLHNPSTCTLGHFHVPEGQGLCSYPNDAAYQYMTQVF